MNDLSDEVFRQQHCCTCKPIPCLALYILVPIFFLALSLSLFILLVVHNAFFFLSVLVLSALVFSFVAWNTLSWRTKRAVFLFLHSFPESDLRLARDGQLVKITGLVTCGGISLESSYERVTRCIYASTLLHEYRGISLKPVNAGSGKSCFQWNLTHCERFSTDFYITDCKSGIRAMVKAGTNCKVIPLIVESRLVNTTGRCRILSPHLRKWLRDRNLSAEARLLRLEEGYIKEGSSATVIGMLHRNNDIMMIVEPSELISTGCVWRKLLLPVDVDGLILGVPDTAGSVTNPVSMVQQPDQ